MPKTIFHVDPKKIVEIEVIAEKYWVLTISQPYGNDKVVLEDTIARK